MKRVNLLIIVIFITSFLFSETIVLDKVSIKNYYPRIGIALGGGSAKGFYHLGVLEALEENNIPLYAISGSSMGAVIGGVYALGYNTAEIKKIIKQLDLNNVFTVSSMGKQFPFTYEHGWFNFLRKEPIGFADSYSIEEEIKKYTFNYDYFRNFDFDKYPIKLRIVATEFPSGIEAVYSKGPLYNAVLSSISIPFILKPYYWRGKYFLDGVLSEVVPLTPLQEMDLDFIIGVDVVGSHNIEESVYQLHRFALQYFDLNVRKIGQSGKTAADILISIPYDKDLTRIDFVKYEQFINKGKKILDSYMDDINKRISLYDKQQMIVINKITAEDGFIIPPYEKGKENSKSRVLRDIFILNGFKPLTVDILRDVSGVKFHLCSYIDDVINKINIIDSENYSFLKDSEYNEILQSNTILKYNKSNIERLTKAIINSGSKGSTSLIVPEYNFHEGVLTVVIKKARIDEVRIKGNHFLPKEFILRHMQIALHDTYMQSRINQSLATLYQTGLFDDVFISYQKSKDGLGLILDVEVKEKPRVSGWVGSSYFSLEKNLEINTGADIFTRLFNQDVKSSVEIATGKGYQRGLEFNMFFYNTYADMEVMHEHRERDLSVFHPEEAGETFNYYYELDRQTLGFQLQSYDYLKFFMGMQNNCVIVSQKDPKAVPCFQNQYYKLFYDGMDKNWFPDDGVKVDVELERGAVIDHHEVSITKVDFWIAKEISQVGTFWLQAQTYHTNTSDKMYLWYSPHRYRQPNGMFFNEVFSYSYSYYRLSFLQQIFLGSRVEFNIDRTRYKSIDNELYISYGAGVMFHYPSNLGIFTMGYGLNEHRGLWQINLSKRF